MVLEGKHKEFYNKAKLFMERKRLVTDPVGTYAYGTDASFYRLIPQIVAFADGEDEVQKLILLADELEVPITFRAAGTSLSGQAITDSVLITASERWMNYEVLDNAMRIRCQPGLVGQRVNDILAPYGRKIGPDPASINAARIGGIVANNASGMCCGVAGNSYHTMHSIRVILSDGTVLDTGDEQSKKEFREKRADIVNGLTRLRARILDNKSLTDKIRHKYRLKNTTGYSINSLVDFEDPVDILAHLMVGSEGTLGFVSNITYNTVEDPKHKAAALVVFESPEEASRAVFALQDKPVAAMELMDYRSLKCMEHQPGMPDWIRSIGKTACALLIDTRNDDLAMLEKQMSTIAASLKQFKIEQMVDFTTDAKVYKQLWTIRKGTFPAVGAVRETGTTVIIEDIAVPVEKMAEAVTKLQALFDKHHYDEALIFGHAMVGNLHFVFTQAFDTQKEIDRYSAFMDDVAQLIAVEYQGSLKGEHGTGRNMAPFVELEWGSDAFKIMQELKALIDPKGVLNPGVILNPSPNAHVEHLKAMPAANPIVDKCIECGFCEPVCPSKNLTLTPRQRITVWREINRLRSVARTSQDTIRLHQMEKAYTYLGEKTCAATGLCAERCPVNINTGRLVQHIRLIDTANWQVRLSNVIANRFAGVAMLGLVGLGALKLAHGVLGPKILTPVMDILNKVTLGTTPKFSDALPGNSRFGGPPSVPARYDAPTVVYWPSCATMVMGPSLAAKDTRTVPEVTAALLEKAGLNVVYPAGLRGLCCGQPFMSKGIVTDADAKLVELNRALLEASEGGKYPILSDTSPCSWRCKESPDLIDSRLKIYEPASFARKYLLPRLDVQPMEGPLALHVTCSSQRSGNAGDMEALARALAKKVVIPPEVTCCGFAGTKGITMPELNNAALQSLPSAVKGCVQGASNSRTCEIGLTRKSGLNYESLLYLLDRQSVPKPKVATTINAGPSFAPAAPAKDH